ncbi:MAG: fido (protein-threonine AMPylation protein), partial [Candidatus Woesearchaeota archaeon]
MTHKYDLFLQVTVTGKISVSDIFVKSKFYYIKQLVSEKLILVKNSMLYTVNSEQTQKLYSLLRFCLDNNLDYDFYTQKSTLSFLSAHFLREKSTLSSNSRQKIRERLAKDSFLTYLSKKPITFIILQHTFFREMLLFFQKKYPDRKTSIHEYSQKLVKLKPLRKLPKKDNFIHTSLQLEGNMLTVRQTQQVLKNELLKETVRPSDIIETANYAKAVQYSEQVRSLDLDDILRLHRFVLAHENFSGEIRAEPVHIKNNPSFQILNHKKITAELQKWIQVFTQKQKTILAVCQTAAYLHNQFQHIHPFLDGNSRTTRLLIQMYFEKHKL